MITLTEQAVSKVDQLITAEGDEGLALRVAVRPGGCSGFSYEMFFDTDRAPVAEFARFAGFDDPDPAGRERARVAIGESGPGESPRNAEA